jgi:hypothetical protein
VPKIEEKVKNFDKFSYKGSLRHLLIKSSAFADGRLIDFSLLYL